AHGAVAGGLGFAAQVGDVAVQPELRRRAAVAAVAGVGVLHQDQRLGGVGGVGDGELGRVAARVALVDVGVAGDAHAVERDLPAAFVGDEQVGVDAHEARGLVPDLDAGVARGDEFAAAGEGLAARVHVARTRGDDVARLADVDEIDVGGALHLRELAVE